MAHATPFAVNGVEKMIYDVRMGPQAVFHGGVIYVVYAANPDGNEGHPHIRAYDTGSGKWSDPVRVGTVSRYDHHYAPVIWVDGASKLHILYGCHHTTGTHLVSSEPGSIAEWDVGPQVAESISYPRVLPLQDGRHLMYSRTLGHMGFWTFRLTDDGQHWKETEPLVDFDRDPQIQWDVWASTYHSVALDSQGTGLHVAFVTFDDGEGVRKRPHPLYGQYIQAYARFNLYYIHIDIDSRRVTNIEGDEVPPPVNRAAGEKCMVLDSDRRATNPPSMVDDGTGKPTLMFPIASPENAWEGEHVFYRRRDDHWSRTPVASLNNTWSANWLIPRDDRIDALLTRGPADGSLLPYGGGQVERWHSADDGDTCEQDGVFMPDEELICNNPRPVPTSDGGQLEDSYTMFGWEGSHGLTKESGLNRGKAFLYHDGEWV